VTMFIDTAVFMYAAGTDHPLRRPCAAVIERIIAGEIEARTSVEVVQEILHRFIAIGRPELGRLISRQVLDGFSPVLPFTHEVAATLPELSERYPRLAARDLVHVATCIREGIAEIVSSDRGFDQVAEVRRVEPAELGR